MVFQVIIIFYIVSHFFFLNVPLSAITYNASIHSYIKCIVKCIRTTKNFLNAQISIFFYNRICCSCSNLCIKNRNSHLIVSISIFDLHCYYYRIKRCRYPLFPGSLTNSMASISATGHVQPPPPSPPGHDPRTTSIQALRMRAKEHVESITKGLQMVWSTPNDSFKPRITVRSSGVIDTWHEITNVNLREPSSNILGTSRRVILSSATDESERAWFRDWSKSLNMKKLRTRRFTLCDKWTNNPTRAPTGAFFSSSPLVLATRIKLTWLLIYISVK